MEILNVALPALGDAFLTVIQPLHLMYMVAGVLLGL